jgi:low temperature requirement protein LtrA
VATVSLWYLYFQRAEDLGLRASEEAGDPSGVAALGTQVLTILVIALIAIAVSDEFAIAHPGDEPTAGFQLLAFGGPALFLGGQLLFMWRVPGTALRGRVAAVAVNDSRDP